MLYVSDGTDRLFRVHADTFETDSIFKATYPDGKSARKLNELEWVNGLIWANLFTTDNVVSIDPDTGIIQQKINFKSLI